MVERGRRHAEWPEHSSLHGLVVRGAELELGISDVPADEPCRRHEQVRILEHLTELARRRERREPVELLFRRAAPDFENVPVVARRPRAGANEMLQANARGRFRASELERRIDGGNGRFPGKLSLLDELREHQRRERLRIGRDHEQRIFVDRRLLPELAHAETAGERDLAVLNDSHRDAGDAELALRRGDEPLELRNLGRTEAPRLLSSERFTFEPFRQKATVDELRAEQSAWR